MSREGRAPEGRKQGKVNNHPIIVNNHPIIVAAFHDSWRELSKYGQLKRVWPIDGPFHLFLDDERSPDDVYPGVEKDWSVVRRLGVMKGIMTMITVTSMSLDHDLGACEECMAGRSQLQWLEEHHFQTMPHCGHVGTGLDLVKWMVEGGHWPKQKPAVHSANREGRAAMQALIDTHFGQGPQGKRSV